MKMRHRARLLKRRRLPKLSLNWSEYTVVLVNDNAWAEALKDGPIEPDDDTDSNAPLMQGRVGTFDGLKIVEGNYRGPLDQPTYLYPDVKEQTCCTLSIGLKT